MKFLTRFFLLILAIIAFFWYVELKVREKKIEIVSTALTTVFEEDILFLTPVLISTCEDHQNLSDLVFLIKSGRYESSPEDSLRAVQEMLAIMHRVPQQIRKLQPRNHVQRQFKEGLLRSFEKSQVHLINSGNMNSQKTKIRIAKFQEETEKQLSTIGLDVYFQDKVSQISVSLMKQGFIDNLLTKIALNDVKDWDAMLDAKTLLAVVDTLHAIAIKNPEYERAYQAGCMKTLKEQVEILIAQQHTDFFELRQ